MMFTQNEMSIPDTGLNSSDPKRITPYKLFVSIAIRDYFALYIYKEEESGVNDVEILENLSPKQRSKFSLLMLKLIQGVDISCRDLIAEFENPERGLPRALFNEWKRNLAMVISNGVGGLMDLSASIDKYVADQHMHLIHRCSVIGLFLRRIVLHFDMLRFSEVSHLFHDFKEYYSLGMDDETVQSKLDIDLDVSSLSEEVAHINGVEGASFGRDFQYVSDDHFHEQTQAELYIARQVELLQSVEHHADSPEEIQKMVHKILQSNSDLVASHFLSYLNCLRVNEYTGAIRSLKMAFGPDSKRLSTTASTATSAAAASANANISSEEMNRGFRYAALNLAALHARFNHRTEALAALKEAIMLAQESNDHICLQHALSWLYRVQEEDIDREILVKRCIAKSSDLNLSYLTSLGIQSLSQLYAIISARPSLVMEVLTKSDILNCKHSIVELITSSYSQKSAFWTMYGRTQMSCMVSQLLLNLDTSDPTREGLYVVAEAFVIALSNVARHLHDHGHYKVSEKIIGLAKSLYKSQSSPYGKIWHSTQLHIEFQKAIHQTNWVAAERIISEISAIETVEPLFLKFQLYLERGDASVASDVRDALLKLDKKDPFPTSDRVRFLIHQAELFCITGSFSNAITPLTTASLMCKRFHMEFLHSVVSLHLGHIQLQLGMANKSLEVVENYLPIVLSHGTLYDSSRAYLLMAKCRVAAASPTNSDPRRADIFAAIKYLKLALNGFKKMQSHHRSKDVLYIMARLYHVLELVQERNQIAAEFKKLDEQYPTNTSSKLANMV